MSAQFTAIFFTKVRHQGPVHVKPKVDAREDYLQRRLRGSRAGRGPPVHVHTSAEGAGGALQFLGGHVVPIIGAAAQEPGLLRKAILA